MPTIVLLLGWIGTAFILFAYWRRNELRQSVYAGLNFLGAAMVGVNCYMQAAWPPLGLQLCWMAIAIRDLVTSSKLGPSGASLELEDHPESDS